MLHLLYDLLHPRLDRIVLPALHQDFPPLVVRNHVLRSKGPEPVDFRAFRTDEGRGGMQAVLPDQVVRTREWPPRVVHQMGAARLVLLIPDPEELLRRLLVSDQRPVDVRHQQHRVRRRRRQHRERTELLDAMHPLQHLRLAIPLPKHHLVLPRFEHPAAFQHDRVASIERDLHGRDGRALALAEEVVPVGSCRFPAEARAFAEGNHPLKNVTVGDFLRGGESKGDRRLRAPQTRSLPPGVGDCPQSGSHTPYDVVTAGRCALE
mmetsp:Transcript_45139/g.107661  ORF Transcript_45139/g.107661 Transcript_45139/m.107661 type:complete len:264 (-) Transcript_45139:101-892(-)